MTDFKSEFEKLVADTDLTNVDENFKREFPDHDFVIDDKEMINIDGVIDELYMQCEKFEPLLKSAEIDDNVLEELDNESIIDLLRDVFKEEVKARPVSVLAKELENSIRKKEDDNNRKSFMSTRSSSYMTAREENSDYESPDGDSDTFSDYNSCDEGLSSPGMVRTIMNKQEFLRSYSREREEVEEQYVVDNEMMNYTEFRVRKEEITNMKGKEEDEKLNGKKEDEKKDQKKEVRKVEHNENEFREEVKVQENEKVMNYVSFRVREEETDDLKNEEDGKLVGMEVDVKEDQRTVVTIEEHNENDIRKEKNEEVENRKDDEKNAEKAKEVEANAVIRRKEFKESIQKTVEDNISEVNGFSNTSDRKRKISQKAVEIAENIVIGKPIPLRSSTVDSPQRLPLIRVPLMKKERPNRRSLERMSTEENRTKFLELLKKMELKQDDESYHSVYNNH